MADVASRGNRADEVRQERRRKPGSTTHLGVKLGVDEDQIDRKTYHYRWANDVGNRIDALKANDYDPAPIDGRSTEARVVGTDSGKPVNGVLMRKRRDWYEADQKEKQRPLDEMDKDIKRGAHRNDAELGNDVTYSPNDGNTLDIPRQR